MALPLILAGPMLRRVDGTVFTVFVALSRAGTVEVRLWAGSQLSSGIGTVQSGQGALASGQAATRRFGANLHIAVVAVDLVGPPAVPVTPGTAHSYDVIIDGAHNLRSEGLLRDEASGARMAGVDASAPLHLALGYDEDRLPGFVAPAATIAALKLAHASCRKANYDSYDALGWLDDFLKDNKNDRAAKWPQQLFLTGDQIYADDVAGAHLHMLNLLGQEVLGGTDQLTINGQAHNVTVATFPPLRRGLTIRQQARMSTTESASHLIGFGEFAAMYLCAWSPRVWRALGTDGQLFDAAVPPIATQQFVTDWSVAYDGPTQPARFQAWKDDKDKGLEAAQKARAGVELYREIVPKVARALANCATCMIWDDHEVTDDWNLSGKWIANVFAPANSAGQAIVRNGMMAYGLFQGWGNDPKAFRSGNNADFLTEAEAIMAGNGPFPAAPVNRMHEILGFPGAAANRRAKWHYTVDGPIHRVVVLDTRTLRDTRPAGSVRPPILLGDTLEDQLPAGPLANGRELLVLVSAAPVVGPMILDDVLQPVAARAIDMGSAITGKTADVDQALPTNRKALDAILGQASGSAYVDVEGWAADDQHREKLLARLAGYASTLILSGDVHFSATLTLDLWRASAATPSRMVQLTSSGARNGWMIAVESQFRMHSVLQDMLGNVAVERLAWTNAPAGLNPGTFPGSTQQNSVSPGRRTRMAQSPALLPAAGWPPGTTVTRAPDWRWRLRIVTDTRAVGSTGRPAPPALTGGGDVPASGGIAQTFERLVATAKRHQLATQTKPRLLRTMVFIANMGLVDFRADGTGTIVTHRLMTPASPGSPTFAFNTVHEARLTTPASDAAPTLQTV